MSGDAALEIDRLSSLSPVEYELARRDAAKRLKLRVSTLDDVVRRARNAVAVPVGQGRPLETLQPEPWLDPIDGVELLDAISGALRRHVVMNPASVLAAALWVLAVYAFELFALFPRLAIISPEKGCGKTTLLDLLSRLVPKPLFAANVTAAAVFRTIEDIRPTLLIDEADTYLPSNPELRNVLNSGHRRDGTVVRCAGDGAPRQFSTSAPAAIAAIGRLPGTLEDRSIMLRLRRRRVDEPVALLRLDQETDYLELARKAARWTHDATALLTGADPSIPQGLFNRVADNWRPLLAVADAAGGEWPSRARATALALSGAEIDDDSQSKGVRLLHDLRDLFHTEPSGVLFSEEIVQRLTAMEERPWAEFLLGKPITKPQLAKLLNPFRVKPGSVRRGERTSKGYRKHDLTDAFERYLPAPVVTPSRSTAEVASVSRGQTLRAAQCDGSQSAANTKETVGCDGVTANSVVGRQKDDDLLQIPEFLLRTWVKSA